MMTPWVTGLRIVVEPRVAAMSCRAKFAVWLALAILWTYGPSAHAACSDNAPTTGQTVTCDTSPPNPDPSGVIAEAGSTDVTVNILSGAGISTSGDEVAAVLVRSDSDVDNHGTVTTSGDAAPGLIAVGDNSTLTNGGTVSTSGQEIFGPDDRFDGAYGIVAFGDNAVLTNNGTVTTSGTLAHGLLSAGSDNLDPGFNNRLTNSGTVTVSRTARGLAAFGDNNTVTNSGTVTASEQALSGLVAFGNNNAVTNSGIVAVEGRFSGEGGLAVSGENNMAINDGAITATRDNNGLIASGSNSTLINNGTVTLSGGGSGAGGLAGNTGTNLTLINNGTVIISGTNRHGLLAFGDHNTLINNGTITSSGRFSTGLIADGSGLRMTNSGNITTAGLFAHGIEATFAHNSTLTNNGTIAASGVDAVGVRMPGSQDFGTESSTFTNAGGAIVTSQRAQAVSGGFFTQLVVNAGTLSGNGTAVDLREGDDTLQLETTSVINGVSDGGPDVDELILSGVGEASLDLDEFVNFETLRKVDASTWRLIGSGSFNDMRLEAGELSIDDTITVDRSYVQDPEGTLRVDTADGGGVRVIGTPGTATVGGALVIEGSPGPNALVDVVSASGGIQGDFDTVKVPPADGRITTAVRQLPNSVQVATVSPANVDAIVDEGLNKRICFWTL